MLDWTFWVINLAIPLSVLLYNVSQRGFTVAGAAAPSDWILLLVGVDFAAVALMATGKSPAIVGPFGGVVVVAAVLGLGVHALSRKVCEVRVVRAIEAREFLTEADGRIEKIKATGKILVEYGLALFLPLAWTAGHMFVYTRGGWNG